MINPFKSIIIDVKFFLCITLRLFIDGVNCPVKSFPTNEVYWLFNHKLYYGIIKSQNDFKNSRILEIYEFDGSFSGIPKNIDHNTLQRNLICFSRNPKFWEFVTGETVNIQRTFWEDRWYISETLVARQFYFFHKPLKLLRGFLQRTEITSYNSNILPHLVGIVVLRIRQ
ncbi:MAG: hypothetical protein LBQ54_13500 [Planctomycetaceae bacterium]|nr:hypothetical protein [Planctomycetaceae bacterium]